MESKSLALAGGFFITSAIWEDPKSQILSSEASTPCPHLSTQQTNPEPLGVKLQAQWGFSNVRMLSPPRKEEGFCQKSHLLTLDLPDWEERSSESHGNLVRKDGMSQISIGVSLVLKTCIHE